QWGNDFGERSQKITCEIFNAAESKLREQFKGRFGTFYFVSGPYSRDRSEKVHQMYFEGIKGCLKPEIRFVDIPPPDAYVDDPGGFHIDRKYDPHPNARANEWLIERFISAEASD
ncbi:MAG: hypothetical protein AAF202_13770, partial [Pseudomonadota bacterium]